MDNLTFNKLLNNLPQSIWNKITQIDELKGQWVGGLNLNPTILTRLKKSVLITSTGASTRIEGAQLSDEDIEKMMKGIDIQQFADRDKQEVRGYFELLTNVFSSWDQLHFSENLIKHFHQELLKLDITSPYLTPKEMSDLTETTKKSLNEKQYHPLLIIAAFIVSFLQIHPFQDGNGRSSRILTNLLLLQAGYEYMPYISHEKIIEDNKPDYYMALRSSQKTLNTDSPDIIPWLDFFLDTIMEQSQQAVGLLTSENLTKLLSPTQLKVWEYLQEKEEATPLELSNVLNIPRPTINQVTTKLLRLKKIEKLGEGRATRYRVKIL